MALSDVAERTLLRRLGVPRRYWLLADDPAPRAPNQPASSGGGVDAPQLSLVSDIASDLPVEQVQGPQTSRSPKPIAAHSGSADSPSRTLSVEGGDVPAPMAGVAAEAEVHGTGAVTAGGPTATPTTLMSTVPPATSAGRMGADVHGPTTALSSLSRVGDAVDTDSQLSRASDEHLVPASARTESGATHARTPGSDPTTGTSVLMGEPLAGPRYADAVATLRCITDVFSPQEKLNVLHRAFAKMSAAISRHSGGKTSLVGMDDVLPVFLFVLVEARIPHLGAEVRFLDDFVAVTTASGESQILLTTLRASYFQLQLEMGLAPGET